jgi:hypothetical protein
LKLKGNKMADENGVVTVNSDPVASTDTSLPADAGDTSADVNWSDMALEMDNGADGDDGAVVEGDAEVLGESENSTEPPTSAPATPPTPVAAPAAPAPSTPPVEPVTAAVPTPPTTPPPSQEPPAQPQASYAEWRGKQIEGLEKHYAFDEETSAKLLTEPEVVLPQLAARLHMEVTEHVMRSVMSAMPQWMDNMNQGRTREADAQSMFETINPDLKDPSYKNAILQMGMAYRQMNPNAPAEEAVKVIGNMVRSALGLAAPQSAPGMVVVPQAAPAPAAPAPFTPVRGGGGAAVPVQTSNNPWASMAEEFLTE